MNRMFFLAVVGLMAVGATGCATGVEDPQPDPKPVTQSRGTPAVPFSAEIDQAPITDTASIGGGLDVDNPQYFEPQPEEAPAAEEPAAPSPRFAPKLEEQPVNG